MLRRVESSQGAKRVEGWKWVWRSRRTPAEEAHWGLLIALEVSYAISRSGAGELGGGA
jgi:hypothetical protein